jgi:hypothetical protein
MHLTQVIWHGGLQAFGLKTGNCLSDLGAVRTAADINRDRTAQLIFIIDLNQPFGQRRSLLRLQHEFWPASNRMPASRSNDLTWAKRITVKFFSKNCKKRLDMPHSGMLHNISPVRMLLKISQCLSPNGGSYPREPPFSWGILPLQPDPDKPQPKRINHENTK